MALAPEPAAADSEQGAPPAAPEAVQVRVVAPCALPPKYRLPVVTTQGDQFDVYVPDGGAREGEEFAATQIPVKPWTGRFSDGLLDCGNGEGATVFAIAFCCPGVVYAAIMEKLNLSECGGPGGNASGQPTFWIVTAATAIVVLTQFILLTSADGEKTPGWIALLNQGTFVYLCVAFTWARASVRRRYSIGGHCCVDCLLGWWCTCCSALQMYRHMKRSGERPARFDHIQAEATIV